ncbi:MAG: class I SAM-dependent methyltransferase [Deltaproteobacteria bacterium]|nr:class I SAM-dependent methyltransferase [Deltaproteobacteria bacterium]
MAKKNKKEDFDNMLMNHKDLFVRIKGIKLKMREGVFSPDPAITNSTSLLVNSIKNVKDKDVLDLGCGSGVISIYCAKNGAKRVVASDVDVKAIRNTKENLGSLGLSGKVEVVKSSLFENIDGKFDFIFGNLPINEN